MAAEQRSGRVCACGCGTPIDNLHYSSRYAKACADTRYVLRKRAANDRRRNRTQEARQREHRNASEESKALSPHSRQVSNAFDPVQRPRPIVCKRCQGMPWARTSRRHDERFETVAVVPPFTCPIRPPAVCRGCGEQYAPEPEPERTNVLGSSAGLAVREGRLYGLASEPANNRASRAKIKLS